jgi:hypothetical protein
MKITNVPSNSRHIVYVNNYKHGTARNFEVVSAIFDVDDYEDDDDNP